MAFGQPRLAHAQKEELVDQVKNAIEAGKKYLRQTQDAQGRWERGGFGGVGGIGITDGGQSCLAMLALLNAGEPHDSDTIKLGLRYVRSLPPQGTYVVGLQTMVLAEMHDPGDLLTIRRNVQWLLSSVEKNGFTGWSYQPAFRGFSSDFSNTQYAVLGLHAGKQAGIPINDEVWRVIMDLYKQAQKPDGSWSYTIADPNPRLTMTTAGLCGLLITGAERRSGRQQLNRETGVAKNCGIYDEDANIRKALDWMKQPGHFSFNDRQYRYYSIYGIERAGRLSGQRFMADRDWYREGCKFLVGEQQADGSWNGGGFNGGTVGSTAFALLFLSKGRSPVLISKLPWGTTEWNNKHHDAQHLVEFASREMFQNTPLAWQIYDCRIANQNEILQHAGELLQSPIVYFNGHEAPQLTGVQKDILKKYIQEGGFVFAEACCGSKEFTKGFRDLMKEMFDKDMVPVTADHALYHAWKPMKPQDAARFPLERLDLGCKTVVVLSTNPLAGWWEEDLYKDPVGSLAFRMAGNIIAYATNMELPKPKLTKSDLVQEKTEIKITRNFLEVAQIKHSGDWEPAPAAMRNLMLHLRAVDKLDVSLKKVDISLDSNRIFQHRFLYMHGRRKFDYNDTALQNLRAHLKTGGLLLADACCGSSEFDASFREMANKLFPDAKLEQIPENDPLYGSELNGAKIDLVMCRRPREGSGNVELQKTRPWLEGIRLAGRWVVIYSKYDLGCALEKHPSADCIGYDHESALKLAGAAVLYYLKN
jgi:hypothetical protein